MTNGLPPQKARRTGLKWLERRIPPPIVGALVAVAMWSVPVLGPQLAIGSMAGSAVVGILVLAALAFDLLGIVAFRAARTTINPLKPERATALVTGGVYRVTRNPMYVGLGLLLSAWAVYLGALLPVAGPIAFVLYITRFQIQPEERVLREKFGDAYTAYAARVRRWV